MGVKLALNSYPERARHCRYLALVRAGLALACFAVEMLSAGEPGWSMRIVTAGFSIYAIVMAARGGARNRAFELLTLFLDAVFFMALAQYGGPGSLWLASGVYAYLMLSAQHLYGTKEVFLVAALSGLFVLVAHQGRTSALGQTIMVGSALGIVGAVIKSKTLSRMESLAASARHAAAEASSAREIERQRIAADFHDGPLQSFLSFQIRLDVLRKILERDLATGLDELRQLQQLSQAQVKELRSFVRSMRPVDAEASMVAAIRRLADDFQKESGIAVTFVGGDKPVPVAPEISTDVLQMVREALHNVQKHAQASRVAVAIEIRGKVMEISIDDNGAGFPFSGAYSLDELDLLRLGPVSLRRRARAIGADVLLESRPGRGAGLKLKIPL